MTDPSQLRSVRLTRVFDAPIELVFRAWTEAEHVTRWMKCGQDVELTVAASHPAGTVTRGGVEPKASKGHVSRQSAVTVAVQYADPDTAAFTCGCPFFAVPVYSSVFSESRYFHLCF